MTEQQMANGSAWLNEHVDHVARLIMDGDSAVEPTGSDANYPYLWKPSHWRWYLKEERRLLRFEEIYRL